MGPVDFIRAAVWVSCFHSRVVLSDRVALLAAAGHPPRPPEGIPGNAARIGGTPARDGGERRLTAEAVPPFLLSQESMGGGTRRRERGGNGVEPVRFQAVYETYMMNAKPETSVQCVQH